MAQRTIEADASEAHLLREQRMGCHAALARLALVSALMTLFGTWNRWLPRVRAA